MGSSSKKSQAAPAPATPPQAAAAIAAPPAPPTMGSSDLPDVGGMPYFANASEVAAGGGHVRPTAPPGAMQGAGLNWFVPPPPPPPPPPQALAPAPTRTSLAGAMTPATPARSSQVNPYETQYKTYGRNSR